MNCGRDKSATGTAIAKSAIDEFVDGLVSISAPAQRPSISVHARIALARSLAKGEAVLCGKLRMFHLRRVVELKFLHATQDLAQLRREASVSPQYRQGGLRFLRRQRRPIPHHHYRRLARHLGSHGLGSRPLRKPQVSSALSVPAMELAVSESRRRTCNRR
jgi:hypothetical protein